MKLDVAIVVGEVAVLRARSNGMKIHHRAPARTSKVKERY
jgi:hypothetical protein